MGDTIDDVIKSLLVSINHIKANSNKCHLITNKLSCMNLKIENINVENNTYQKTT